VGMPGDYVSVGTPGDKGEELMIQVSFQSYCSLVNHVADVVVIGP
jgi:hypothetical protein